jgi:hypothetical protein
MVHRGEFTPSAMLFHFSSFGNSNWSGAKCGSPKNFGNKLDAPAYIDMEALW